jgi:hypothetical protein
MYARASRGRGILYRRPLPRRAARPIIGSVANPRIRRLTLIPYAGADDSHRRYRLAHLDEVALASPPGPSLAASAEAPAHDPPAAEGDRGAPAAS